MGLIVRCVAGAVADPLELDASGFAGPVGLLQAIRREPDLVANFLGSALAENRGIGAYLPRAVMAPVHLDPHEAVQARADLGVAQAVGMHFGTWQLTDEGVDDPVTALHAARDAAGLAPDAFAVLGFGETRLFTLGSRA